MDLRRNLNDSLAEESDAMKTNHMWPDQLAAVGQDFGMQKMRVRVPPYQMREVWQASRGPSHRR